MARNILKASVGDRLVVHAHHQGEPEHDGEILEVPAADGAPPYVVRWDDGRVTTVYPGSDVSIEHFGSAKDS
jgi:Domain of unknown function (DUF1918)